MITDAGKSEIRRVGWQGGDWERRLLLKSEGPAGGIPFSGNSGFFLRLSTAWMRFTYFMESNPLYSKSDFNIHLIQKNTFTATSKTCLTDIWILYLGQVDSKKLTITPNNPISVLKAKSKNQNPIFYKYSLEACTKIGIASLSVIGKSKNKKNE